MIDNLNSSAIHIIVQLWIVDEQEALFNEYETIAMKIMSNYGGKLLSATVIHETSAKNLPNEVHILEFPNLQSFENYKSDGELKGLTDMRSKCIHTTEIQIGHSNQNLILD